MLKGSSVQRMSCHLLYLEYASARVRPLQKSDQQNLQEGEWLAECVLHQQQLECEKKQTRDTLLARSASLDERVALITVDLQPL